MQDYPQGPASFLFERSQSLQVRAMAVSRDVEHVIFELQYFRSIFEYEMMPVPVLQRMINSIIGPRSV